MIVELQPGEKVQIRFADTDGEMTVYFDAPPHHNTVTVEETAGLSDTSGRTGVLYQEKFGLSFFGNSS